MAFLLRVELPDVPGSLGRVATAIGEAGGDIGAIEIVEHRGDGFAVDDVLLDLAHGTMPDSVVSACNLLDGVHVLWISRYEAGGQLFLDLEAVEQMTADPPSALDALVDLMPQTFKTDWAMRVRRTDAGFEQVHSTSAAPDLPDDLEWPELKRAAAIEVPDHWQPLEVAGAPLAHPDDLLVIGRRGGPEILDSELARLGHLAALAVSIAASADPDGS